MTRFYIENFGCRATQADGAAIERQLTDRGISRANDPEAAEIVVLNTCTVTQSADKDARASIRRLKRVNPNCRILVTGCYAQRAPKEISALPGVTWVVGNSHKHLIGEIATSARKAELGEASSLQLSRSPYNPAAGFVPLQTLAAKLPADVLVGDIFAHSELLAAPVFEAANERTRPNLKVQDGCNNRCSFCVIPSVRGQSRSMPADRVIAEVQALVAAGYREVVVSGINLGRWGRDFKLSSVPEENLQLNASTVDRRLVGLVRAILQNTSLEKLRISSVEPMDWSGELIALMAGSDRIAKHAHVPMQSGSDAVLRRMHRKYRPWHYREKILKIREAMPSAAIGADVMVGFPGETDFEFGETRRMIEDLPLTYLHVFTYSRRPGTPAAMAGSQVPGPVARERSVILRELGAAKKAAFMQSMVGTRLRAITLQTRDSKFTEALTDNYLKSKIAGQHISNHWFEVVIRSAQDDFLTGNLAQAA